MSESIPPWVHLVDSLALAALRAHFQIELDLRAILRSQGDSEDTLDRAERLLKDGVGECTAQILVARGLLSMSRCGISEEEARRLGEQIAAMQVMLFARASRWGCIEYFRESEPENALEFSRAVAGLVPLAVDVEREMSCIFDKPRGEGIPTA